MALALRKKNSVDMTTGSLWDKIFIFAIPLILSGFLQQLFHSVDMAVVGKFAGKAELAAVGSNGSITNLLVNSVMGFSIGSNVVIARLLGGNRVKTAKKAVYTSLIIAFVSGILIMLVGISCSRFLLELISSPPDVIDLAEIYLKIYFAGVPFLLMYNFSAAIMRSRGKTGITLYCLFIGGVVNVVFNLIFVIGFKWDVAGVAIATGISHLVSCVIILVVMFRDKSEHRLEFKEFCFDKYIFSKIIITGIPIAIQSVIFPLSNMLVQSSVNSLGTSTVAGWAAAAAVVSYINAVMTGFDQADISFISQNLGAKKIKRCKKITKICFVSNVVTTMLVSLVVIAFSDFIFNMFTSDADVVAVAKYRLIFTFCYLPIAISMNTLTYSLRGLGHSIIPTIVSLFGVCFVRSVWLLVVFKKFPTLLTVLGTYPISQGVVAIILLVMYIIVIKKLSLKIGGQENVGEN